MLSNALHVMHAFMQTINVDDIQIPQDRAEQLIRSNRTVVASQEVPDAQPADDDMEADNVPDVDCMSYNDLIDYLLATHAARAEDAGAKSARQERVRAWAQKVCSALDG